MKRKKFLALALAGVMTAATLTACAPLEDLYDWFFGGGSGGGFEGQAKFGHAAGDRAGHEGLLNRESMGKPHAIGRCRP